MFSYYIVMAQTVRLGSKATIWSHRESCLLKVIENFFLRRFLNAKEKKRSEYEELKRTGIMEIIKWELEKQCVTN